MKSGVCLVAFSNKGYFYTFVTNQSAHRVYYNNLKITRQRGTLRAMNNYYPFGLMWDNPETMPNATYQGKELQTDTWSDGSELALYDFGARMYDPVLGRWHCAAQQFLTEAQRRFRNASPEKFGASPEKFGNPMYQFDSPYNAMANNPVVNIDPDGMWSIPWGNIMSSIGGFLSSMTTTTSWVSLPFMSRNSITTRPYSQVGTLAQVGGMLAQWGMDGKMIKDAAGEMGKALLKNDFGPDQIPTFMDGIYQTSPSQNELPSRELWKGQVTMDEQYGYVNVAWTTIVDVHLENNTNDNQNSTLLHVFGTVEYIDNYGFMHIQTATAKLTDQNGKVIEQKLKLTKCEIGPCITDPGSAGSTTFELPNTPDGSLDNSYTLEVTFKVSFLESGRSSGGVPTKIGSLGTTLKPSFNPDYAVDFVHEIQNTKEDEHSRKFRARSRGHLHGEHPKRASASIRRCFG
jgi:hypothetical protein